LFNKLPSAVFLGANKYKYSYEI